MKQIFLFFAALVLVGSTAVYAQQAVQMPKMIYVEGGTFRMGNDIGNADERPVHEVTLNSFYIGEFEVTYKEFKRFVDATGYVTDAEQTDTFRLKHNLPPRNVNNGSWTINPNGRPVPLTDTMKPVGNISWFDAVAYCNWLSKETGKQFRLPTEAEWEYAARGGVKSKGYTYAGSNNLDEVAWYIGNSSAQRRIVGQKLPNELGIYDMAGNAREWCSDWYGESYYKISPAGNPQGPDNGKNRVIRGGSWGSEAGRMRVTYRNEEYPYNAALDFGFRLAVSSDEPAKTAPKPPTEESDMMKKFDEQGFVDIYGIYFDIGKWKVKPESYPVIDQFTGYMKDHPTLKVIIEGHTDNTGDDAKNMTLSDKRAQSVRDEFVKRGIDPSRMETKGYGETKPIADNNTKEGRTQNRRVTIVKQK